MNTPKTVAAIDELVIKGISVAEQIYLSAKDDAQAIRQLETQVQELREALKETLRYADMMHDKSEEGPNNPTAQAIGKAIRKASAILEKTRK